jgi:hypothetical protein
MSIREHDADTIAYGEGEELAASHTVVTPAVVITLVCFRFSDPQVERHNPPTFLPAQQLASSCLQAVQRAFHAFTTATSLWPTAQQEPPPAFAMLCEATDTAMF